MADEYVQARKSAQESKQISPGEKINKDPRQCHMCRKAGHTARDCRIKTTGGRKEMKKEDQEKMNEGRTYTVLTAIEGDTCQ